MPVERMPDSYLNSNGYSDLSKVQTIDDLKKLSGKFPQTNTNTQKIPQTDIPEISLNDLVQLKLGSLDVQSGKVISPNDPYVENSNAWAHVIDINENYTTNGKYNLPNKITAIQVGTKDGTVMHTVQTTAIANNRVVGNSSSIAIQALAPIANILNLNVKDLSSIGNVLGSATSLASLLGENKVSKEVQQGWQKLMYYDNFISSKYKQAESIYNQVVDLLFGKKKKNALETLIGVLGAGSQIQNYVNTTRLSDSRTASKSSNSSGLTGALSKVMNVLGKVDQLTSSIKQLTGTSSNGSKGQAQTGAATQMVNFPSLFGPNGMTVKSETVNTAGNLSAVGSNFGMQLGTGQQTTQNTTTSGTYNSVEYAKLVGQAIKEGDPNQVAAAKQTAKQPENQLTYRDLTEEEQKNIWINKLEGFRVVNNIEKSVFSNFLSNQANIDLLTNEDKTQLQNAFGYPVQTDQKSGWEVNKIVNEENKNLMVRQYNYQINIDDPNLSQVTTPSIEDKLMMARRQLGIQVHGNNRLGKAIKYFLYNRYKNIDGGNLAWNRMITHVFFTRPDLNLLYHHGGILPELKNFSDVTLLWQRDPNLFRLLTDCKRTGESHQNNFNLLLSNQITNMEFKDETITKVETTKTWKDQKVIYGGSYTGRGDGEITCTFLETRDLSITNLIRLWIMYIDNVTCGLWRPSYNLYRSEEEGKDIKVNYNYATDSKQTRNIDVRTRDISFEGTSHIFTRTLDYAASAYAFKLREDGEEIMYWTKYYGLIPISLSLNHLNWQAGSSDSDAKTVSVTFAYSFKKDLSPISLLEFNANSHIDDSDGSETFAEQNFDTTFDTKNDDGTLTAPAGVRSGVPLVGAPFIAIKSIKDVNNKSNFLGFVPMNDDGTEANFSLRLKFKPVPNTDNLGKDGDSSIDYSRIYKHGYAYNNQESSYSILKSLMKDSINSPTDPNKVTVNKTNGKVVSTNQTETTASAQQGSAQTGTVTK